MRKPEAARRNGQVGIDAIKLAMLCHQLADKRKGQDILVLDLRGLSTITDFFVIVSANSEPHLRAIADEIVDGVYKTYRMHPAGVDGTSQSNWIVIDYYDVMVHVMRPEARAYYSLETLWGDAPRVNPAVYSAGQ